MTDRRETEQLLRGLYAARVSGDIAAVYEKFSPDAHFQRPLGWYAARIARPTEEAR